MDKKKYIYLFSLLTIFLTGCDSSKEEVKTWMESEQKKLAGKVSPLPKVAIFIPYTYKSSEQSNPFISKGLSTEEVQDFPDLDRRKEELENFNLESLSMVGFFKLNGKPYALIKTKDNMVYNVTIGNHLGQNFGEVIDVQEGSLTLKEKFKNQAGKGWESKEITVGLVEKK